MEETILLATHNNNNNQQQTTTGTAGTPLIDTCYRNEEARARAIKQIKNPDDEIGDGSNPPRPTSARNQKNFRPEFRVSRFTGD